MLLALAIAAIQAFNVSPLAAVPSSARAHKIFLSTAAYTQIGDVPAGIEWGDWGLAQIAALVEERVACRLAKDYDRADDIKEQLRSLGGDAWGVKVRDDSCEWYVTSRLKRGSTVVKYSAPADEEKEALVEEGSGSIETTEAATEPKAAEVASKADETAATAGAAPAPQGFDWGATF